ncbi:MAG: hypothetical protein HY699_15970, partial [Deltaproteobacteria bacterium]|nr:hypothetical protein [Deltaproteobacteria bacterium]
MELFPLTMWSGIMSASTLRLAIVTTLVVLGWSAAAVRAQPQLPPGTLVRPFTHAYFSNPNRGVVYSDDGPAAVIATEDGGATWRLVLDVDGFDPKDLLDGFFFLDDRRWWLVQGAGRLRRTQDGGRTFETLTPTYIEPRRGNRLSVCGLISFLNEQQGWATCSTALKTTDGGVTWTLALAGRRESQISSLWMFDAGEGVGVGREQVFRTTDGGQTWAAVANSPGLTKLSCIREGFCAGLVWQYGPLMVSRDRGQSWQDTQIPLRLPDQDRITAIHAVRSSLVVAVGTDIGHSYARDVEPVLNAGHPAPSFPPPRALLLKWDGSAWSRATYAEPQVFAGVYFVDANNGWFPAYENAIYKTTDGGQTLQFVPDYFRQIAALTPAEPPLVFDATPTPPPPTPTP